MVFLYRCSCDKLGTPATRYDICSKKYLLTRYNTYTKYILEYRIANVSHDTY